jgi:hypothetical protein
MTRDDEISVDMGLLGTLSLKLSKEIGHLMAQDISSKEKAILEGFLTLIHTSLALIKAINEGLRPENLDLGKYVITQSDALKEISALVHSHPQFRPVD